MGRTSDECSSQSNGALVSAVHEVTNENSFLLVKMNI